MNNKGTGAKAPASDMDFYFEAAYLSPAAAPYPPPVVASALAPDF